MRLKASTSVILLCLLSIPFLVAADENSVTNPMKWLGSYIIAPKSAIDGNAYHNTLDNKSYVMVNGKWTILSEVSVGPQGPKGDKGDQGIQGLPGPIGPQGPVGLTGATGAQGSNGDQGLTGATGAIGQQGPQGEKGEIGPAGPQGPAGPLGDKGDPGSFPAGTNPGDMQYWNGTQWVMVPVGTSGQILKVSASNIPAWSDQDIITDIDGNVYHSVTIGSQTWMVENLKTTRYNDGSAIPLVTDNTAWSNLITPGYCWYYNDAATYKIPYGALYNWYTVNTGKLAPTGWHVPSDAEWSTLTTFLGGESVAGGELKEAGLAHWLFPNAGATNETGFSALPGGARYYDGPFYDIGGNGYWCTSTANDPTNTRYRFMGSSYSNVYNSSFTKKVGYSVRCIRD